jgi:hypothetical protein
MKIRKNCRPIVIDRELYQYKIGRSHIYIYGPDGKRYDTDLSKVSGLSWETIEQLEREKASSGYCTPAIMENWIRKNCKN